MVAKLIKDGNVAVVYSPGFGAGWSTWSSDPDERLKLLFDPGIVDLIERNLLDELENYVTLKYPDFYAGGLADLKVVWLPVGTEFQVHEYDGNESIELKSDMTWIVA